MIIEITNCVIEKDVMAKSDATKRIVRKIHCVQMLASRMLAYFILKYPVKCAHVVPEGAHVSHYFNNQ